MHLTGQCNRVPRVCVCGGKGIVVSDCVLVYLQEKGCGA